jgi:hypothetical protein
MGLSLFPCHILGNCCLQHVTRVPSKALRTFCPRRALTMPSFLELLQKIWGILERSGPIVFLPLAVGLLIGSVGVFLWDSHRIDVVNLEANEARQATSTAKDARAYTQGLFDAKTAEFGTLQDKYKNDTTALQTSLNSALAENAELKSDLAKLQKPPEPPPARPRVSKDPVREAAQFIDTNGVPVGQAFPLMNGRYSLMGKIDTPHQTCTVILTDTTMPDDAEGATQTVTIPLGKVGEIALAGKTVTLFYRYNSECGFSSCEVQGRCAVDAKVK